MNILITNANIYTVDPLQPRARAIAIANNRIVAVGSDAEINAIRLPDMQTLDLNGAFVVPGMIDAHLHLLWTGLAMMRSPMGFSPSSSNRSPTRAANTVPSSRAAYRMPLAIIGEE